MRSKVDALDTGKTGGGMKSTGIKSTKGTIC